MFRTAGESFVASNAVITGDVVLGPGSNLWFGVVVRGDIERITLGANVNLQDHVMVHTDHGIEQEIEAGVVAGHRAILHGRRVGSNTLIGMGAILLSGSVIGGECLIAAGALVPEGMMVPPRSVVMGVPGKVVRSVAEAEVARTIAINARYQELARRYVAGEFPTW
jgi:carbonic anhydrase/acetyltransferase-like protein (isoleucine patch superfamily)